MCAEGPIDRPPPPPPPDYSAINLESVRDIEPIHRDQAPPAADQGDTVEDGGAADAAAAPSPDYSAVNEASTSTDTVDPASVNEIEPQPAGDQQDIPEQDVPEQDVPEQDIPEQDVPEQDVPEQDVPEQDVPEQDIPEQEVPEQDIPEQDIPEQPNGTAEAVGAEAPDYSAVNEPITDTSEQPGPADSGESAESPAQLEAGPEDNQVNPAGTANVDEAGEQNPAAGAASDSEGTQQIRQGTAGVTHTRESRATDDAPPADPPVIVTDGQTGVPFDDKGPAWKFVDMTPPVEGAAPVLFPLNRPSSEAPSVRRVDVASKDVGPAADEVREQLDPATAARDAQGNPVYPGQDAWRNCWAEDGMEVAQFSIGGEPLQSPFVADWQKVLEKTGQDLDSLQKTGIDANMFFRDAQVGALKGRYPDSINVYRIEHGDIEAADCLTQANSPYGSGNERQLYLRGDNPERALNPLEDSDRLVLVRTIPVTNTSRELPQDVAEHFGGAGATGRAWERRVPFPRPKP